MHTPFVWGENDCCMFAAGAVEVQLGINPMQEFIGEYNDLETAQKALKEIGRTTLYATMQSKFGRAVKPMQAARGDIAYMKSPDSGNLGVVMGAETFFVGEDGGKDGLVVVKTKDVHRVFKTEKFKHG